ncbi:MAG: methyltransferase domain-containing protein [Treponema sp.]
MNCRICGSRMSLFENVRNCLYGQMEYKKNPFTIPVKNMCLYKCPKCTHVQSEYDLDDDFYDSYSMWEGASQYVGSKELAVQRIKKILHFVPNAKSILDIGCGTGDFLEVAKNYFPYCYGVEPSQNALIPHSEGVSVFQGYFGEEKLMNKLTKTIRNIGGGFQ